jgi:hypothetical protein
MSSAAAPTTAAPTATADAGLSLFTLMSAAFVTAGVAGDCGLPTTMSCALEGAAKAMTARAATSVRKRAMM